MIKKAVSEHGIWKENRSRYYPKILFDSIDVTWWEYRDLWEGFYFRLFHIYFHRKNLDYDKHGQHTGWPFTLFEISIVDGWKIRELTLFFIEIITTTSHSWNTRKDRDWGDTRWEIRTTLFGITIKKRLVYK